MHLEFFRDKGNTIPDIENPLEIRSIKIWHCKYSTFSEISKCKNLEILVIASYPEENLDLMSSFTKLRYLSILHLPKVVELNGLLKCRSLEALSLSTLPSWDSAGKTTTIKSLEPLFTLENLTHLELFGVVPPDRSPNGLNRCKNLRTVKLTKYNKKETEKLFQHSSFKNERTPISEYQPNNSN